MHFGELVWVQSRQSVFEKFQYIVLPREKTLSGGKKGGEEVWTPIEPRRALEALAGAKTHAWDDLKDRPSSPTLLSQSEGERASQGCQHVRPVVDDRSLRTPTDSEPEDLLIVSKKGDGGIPGSARHKMPKSAAHPPPIVEMNCPNEAFLRQMERIASGPLHVQSRRQPTQLT